MLENAIDAAHNAELSPVVVVLGSQFKEILPVINESEVVVIINTAWENGMSESIKCAIRHLIDINSDEAMIMLVDQPYLNSDILKRLITIQELNQTLISSASYNGICGTPALFHRSLFPELLQLQGDIGANSIIKTHADQLSILPYPQLGIDIDTLADYQKLMK